MSVQEVNNEYVILTENLCKDYIYYKKEAGLKGSLKEYILKEDIDEHIFKSTLARLNFPSNLYNIDIEKRYWNESRCIKDCFCYYDYYS